VVMPWSNDFGKGFENGISRKKILKLKHFSSLKILTSPFYLQRPFGAFLSPSSLFSILFLSLSMLHLFEDLGI
jgi:hypothetical protein